jgi:uncharacterized membrane protein
MNRKALSPLASTIILVVVSIVIGIVVMSWGRSYVSEATSTAELKEAQQREESLFQDLNDRLERGEITVEQYEKIRQVLIEQNR